MRQEELLAIYYVFTRQTKWTDFAGRSAILSCLVDGGLVVVVVLFLVLVLYTYHSELKINRNGTRM